MTIVEFGQKNNRIRTSSILLGAMIITLFLGGIFLYNRLISLRHDVAGNKEIIAKIQVQNAELKDNLYKITDGFDQEALLKANGLVLEKKPSYVISEVPAGPELAQHQ